MSPRQFDHAAAVFVLACVAMTHPSVQAEPPAAEAEAVSYADDIAPMFARHCISCHGPKKQESELRLDVRAALL
ncbi:MAG: hypothetical protein CMJ50_05885 [Planctomycetaceae bacterium]|jgi:mono/diheme cytochrome c family protein|nr:hypothetical protein [Planctomycetaceae bacterium]